MERETIMYRGRKYHRYPQSKRRHLRVYYWRHTEYIPKALHRQMYEDKCGEIPKGYVVHHKDGDPLNNSISNLEVMPRGRHQSEHCQTDKRKQQSINNLERYARPKAIEWHKSDVGREWHRKHASKQREGKCLQCRKKYKYKSIRTKKYCSKNCGAKYLRRKSI